MKTERVVWMLDETIANTRPGDWDTVRGLERELVDIIGSPDISEHKLVDPIPCLKDIAKKIGRERFSSVIDLTGWLTPVIQELCPGVRVEDRFSLSRIRVVSSPKLDTTGYTVSMSPSMIDESKRGLDLSNPLIIDDTSFTGWTSKKTMEIWDLPPEKVTHAFLIANTGSLGIDEHGQAIEGAVAKLESMGSKVIFGFELATPYDDGWHLKDLHQHPRLKQAFDLALSFQEAISNNGHSTNSSHVDNFFTDRRVTDELFPGYMTSEQIRQLNSDGRFILRNGNVVNGDEIHARNPFLWASIYFRNHIDIPKISANRDQVLAILTRIQLMTADHSAKNVAGQALRELVRK